jgi:hypothetical protein
MVTCKLSTTVLLNFLKTTKLSTRPRRPMKCVYIQSQKKRKLALLLAIRCQSSPLMCSTAIAVTKKRKYAPVELMDDLTLGKYTNLKTDVINLRA